MGREGTVASEWETNHSEKFLVACRSVDARKFSFIRYNPFERERGGRGERTTIEFSAEPSKTKERRKTRGKVRRRGYEKKGERKKKIARMEDKREIKRERTCVVTYHLSESDLNLSANNYDR